MPFYSKMLADLTWDDVLELKEAGATEHLRLEFKREIPKKDDLLKKVCAFANTYGGYIIVGAAEVDGGKLAALPGVPKQASFDQQVIQFCFDGIYPPVVPQVSPAIPIPGAADRVIYVIFVEQSMLTPHFVNKRRGCYIRTGEFGQRLDAKLADLPELENLFNQRRQALRRRDFLIRRAEERSRAHLKAARSSDERNGEEPRVHGSEPQLVLTAIPELPGSWQVDPRQLRSVIESARFRARQFDLPDGRFVSQSRGFRFSQPFPARQTYLEIDCEGLVYFEEHLEAPLGIDEETGAVRVRFVFAWLVFCFRYFSILYREMGFNGTLVISLRLSGLLQKSFCFLNDENDRNRHRPIILDNEVRHSTCVSSEELILERSIILEEFFREFYFSVGFTNAFECTPETVGNWISAATTYLSWETIDG